MIIRIDQTDELNKLQSIIQDFDADESIQGIMVYTCDGNNYQKSELDLVLKSCSTAIFGGIFPSIIYDTTKHDIGSIVVGFTMRVVSKIIHDIDDVDRKFHQELSSFYRSITSGKTIIVNIDGLSSGVEAFKEEVFYTLGLTNNYIGGGAGSLSFEKKPCVISNEGLIMNCAIVTYIDMSSGVGVAHGWENVSEPIKVTQSEGNQIISLNWEPAFEVYQSIIKKLSNKLITKDNFFDIAKCYPFGISKMSKEMVVRDPIEVVNETGILCVGAIPQNSFVYILNGDSKSLIEGARMADRLAKEAYKEGHGNEPSEKSVTLFIDCISRVLFLEDEFQNELDVVKSEQLIGALTLGEFANTGKAYLELYNKTSVVAILED